MPSYAEGHSIVMLEALSMGLPMIARNTEEYQEAFSDMIYYYDDIKEIGIDVFDKKHLLAYKKKTKQIKTYDIKTIARQHVKLYENVLHS
jgi:glycosyltransferase involved in cell wall biosynthesis